jgi:hypothetical protein
VDWLVEADVSEKRAGSIIGVEVQASALQFETESFSEPSASTNQSTQCLSPEEHDHNPHILFPI